MHSTPLVSIIIPVHNQLQFTQQCLTSIESNTDPGRYEVIVVNDASTDGTEEFLQLWSGDKPWLRCVTNFENLGFAKSCNQGAGQTTSKYLLFLNNDTVVTPEWLSPLVAALEDNPDIGIVAPKLIFTDGTVQHCGKVWGEWQLPRSHPDHIYYREPGDAPHVNRPRDFQMLTGACLLLRREEFFRYGPFDEQYENGWEDDDLCYVYREQGLRIHYCPVATVVHFQSVTLNEGLSQDEKLLKELSDRAASGVPPDPRLAEMYQKVEQRLLAVRARFDSNRSRFFEKWEQLIFRDDYLYIQADGLAGRLYKDSPPKPLVSIIILTFNQLPYTIECVESIQRHTKERYELIFIDNGSSDASVQWLQTFRDQTAGCTLIANDSNRGFAAGCNQGLAAARGDYLLLLNNDVVVTKGWLAGLLSCSHLRPETGLIGPLTNHISGIQRLQVSPSGPQEGLDVFAERLRIQYGGRRIYNRRIVGFCMLFSRVLFNRVGYLDESFGSGNFEDDDYCLRAELEGYRNVIAGDVFIHHYGSVSFRANKIDYSLALSGNRSVFNRKWSRTISEPVLARKIITLKTCEEADRLSRQGQANAAVDLLLKDGIAQIPTEDRFYRQIAENLLEGGMAEEALQTLAHAPGSDNDIGVLFLRARAAAAMLNLADDLSAFERRVEYSHPAFPGLHLIRGMRALADGNAAGAYEEFGAAARLDMSNEHAYLGLARTTETRGDLAAAFDLYAWSLTVAPGSREAARGLHHCAASAEQQQKASRVLEEALYFRDDDRDLRYLLIDLLIQLGETQQALQHAENAMKLFGADPGLVSAACALRHQVGPMSVSQTRTAEGVSVSLCMIVKNEEKSLPRCLASLKPIVDEIIICDTGSTDGTREIAEAFGARIVDHVWNGDFSAARNRSLAEACGAWILVMDADEVISPLDYDNFRALVCEVRDAKVACSITTRNYINKLVEKWQDHDSRYPAEEAGRGWMPSDKVRLFPNKSDIRFENPIHEMVEPTLDHLRISYPLASSIVVHHYGYLDNDRQETKKTLYYEIGVKKLRESGDSPKAIVELAIQAAGIERYQEAIDLWQRALVYNAESPLAWFNIGYSFLCLGRYDEAFDATKRALELRRDYREALANLALIEILRGRPQAALDMLGEQVGANDDYVMFVLIRAVAYCCKLEHTPAVELFRSVAERQIEFGTFIETTVRHLRQSERGHGADAVVSGAREAGCCIAESVS